MRVEILDEAKADLVAGFRFYEVQAEGLGTRFVEALFAEIDSLSKHAGIHRVVFGSYRVVCRRFPFAVYYRIEGDVARVHAVIDCRRDPGWIQRRVSRN